jgi:hypothetical protein
MLNLAGYIFWPFGKFIAKKKYSTSIWDPPKPMKSEDTSQPSNEQTSLLSDVQGAENDRERNETVIGMPASEEHDLGVGSSSSTALNGRPRSRSTGTQAIPQPPPPLPATKAHLKDRVRQNAPPNIVTPTLESHKPVIENEEDAFRESEEEEDNSSIFSDDIDMASEISVATATPSHPFPEGASSNAIPHRKSTMLSRFIRRWRNGGLAGFIFTCLAFFALAPYHVLVTGACFFFVVSVPMAKLNFLLLRHLLQHPLKLSAHPARDRNLLKLSKTGSAAANSTSSSMHGPAQNGHAQPSTGAPLSTVYNQQVRRPVVPTEDSLRDIIIPPSPMTPTTPFMAFGSGRPRSGTLLSIRASRENLTGRPEASHSADTCDEQEYKIVLCTYNAVGLQYYKVGLELCTFFGDIV